MSGRGKWKQLGWCWWQMILRGLPLVLWFVLNEAWADDVQLRNEWLSVQCDPARLSLTLTPAGHRGIEVSSGFTNAASVVDLQKTSTQAAWRLVEPPMSIQLDLETNGAVIEFTTPRPGLLAWPRWTPDESAHGWILPMFEGVYVSLTQSNSPWRKELVQPGAAFDTTADLTMPFWGLDEGDLTLTCLLQNPFNNQLSFEENGGRMRLRFEHEFTRNQSVKKCGFRFLIGVASPIQPALEYRHQLQENGRFVSMTEKIRRTPEAAKLLGAAHAYLWGDAMLSAADIQDWKGLAGALKNAGSETNHSEIGHWWRILDGDAQKAASEILKAEWPDRYNKGLLANGLNQVLEQTNFCDGLAGDAITLNAEARIFLERGVDSLSTAELCRLNASILYAGLGKYLKPVDTWGEGVSPQMIQDLSAAGFDHLWLGAEGWSGFVKRPETVNAARAAGYLIGTYDSYDSIHPPNLPADQTWPTAQFDAELYRTGAVIKADGQPRRGFLKRGYKLSPIAARPWMERRVSGLMKIFPANSWFMDCDGFGDYFDDYSPLHPATQAMDLSERASRCAWIRDTYQAVIGSEGCSAGMAATLHFSHGVMTPVIGWGDPDLTDHSSKYWLGAYYPPEEPAVFFKPVPLKEKYRELYFDPASRLPLFQTVFHDSVVATHHWSSPSRKFPEVDGTVELLELLYNVPPLYHLNRQEFVRIKTQMKRHYDFFSPLHRELALVPLTDFHWLTADKLVQTAEFGGKVAITANFGAQTYTNTVGQLPAQTIEVRWKDGSRPPLRYQPD